MKEKVKQTIVICFANNKGGSGKSTTCSNVGYAMSTLGKRVLLIDGDGQMNLTLAFFAEQKALQLSQGENLFTTLSGTPAQDAIVKTSYENLDMICSTPRMAEVGDRLITAYEREFVLRKSLESIKSSGLYDAILIDAPPTLGLWTDNILCASDALIIPVEASPWGLFGLANMFERYSSAKSKSGSLHFMGVAITKVNERKSYARQTIDNLRSIPDIHLFDTFIHTDSAIEWAQEASLPVMAYKKTCRSASEYLSLTKEIMRDVSR